MIKSRQMVIIATVALFAVIAILTLAIPPKTTMLQGNDKLQHIAAFFALTLPAACYRPKWLLWMVPLAAGFGGAIELLQPLVGRSRDLADWYADLIGIIAGGALGFVAHHIAKGISTARQPRTVRGGSGSRGRLT